MSDTESLLADPLMHLCHYTRADTAFGHIIPGGSLKLNAYKNMRDPMESKRPEPRQMTWKSRGSEESAEHLHVLQMARDRFRAVRNPMLLVSLTRGDQTLIAREERTFGCAWARPRMWEQYAENHAGVCLVFDRAQLLDELRASLGRLGSYWEGPVHYTPQGFGGSRGAILERGSFHEQTVDHDVLQHVEKHFADFFLLKTTDWATEFEYRFVLHRPDETLGQLVDPVLASYGAALRSVIVGESFPPWQLPGAHRLTEEFGVELRVMQWALGFPGSLVYSE